MVNKSRVLIVEDDKQLSYINCRALEKAGYEVQAARTLAEARRQLSESGPDVILLDVRMPDGNGFDFCREVREAISAHIIFLTSVSDYEGELEGLQSGGDDYLRKPYDIELLRARVAKGIRLNKLAIGAASQVITRGALKLNIPLSQAFFADKDLQLTRKEFLLLLLLMKNENTSMQPDILYEKVWNLPMLDNDGALKIAISRLRKKLEKTEFYIASTRGEGYRFECKI